MLKSITAKAKANRYFLRWLTSRPSTIAGIDIGSCFVKVAEVSFAKGKPVLRAAGIAGIPEGMVKDGQVLNIPALSEILGKLWEDNRLACRDVVAAIDAKSAFVREIAFPAMNPEEVKEAVKWSEKEYIPYEPDSYYYDFSVISPDYPSGAADASSECRVLLAAAQAKTVDDLNALLKMSNLKVWAINIEHLAAKLTFAGFSDGVVLDIGSAYPKMIAFSRGVPVTVRVIPIGREKEMQSHTKLQMENFAKDLAGEVRRAIEYYFIRNPQVECIYLTGGGARLENLAESMAAELGQVQVKVHNPLSCVKMSPLLDQEYLNSAAPQLTVAIGLALSGGIYD